VAMSSETRALTIQACKHCGSGAPTDAHFCPQCDKILSLTRHGDYFSFFGLPRKLNIDVQELDERLRSFSRRFHPDYFYNATTAERLASLERSSYLNDAYRVLRNQTSRIEYLLRLEGMAVADRSKAPPRAPAAFLEDVFALNEQLDEIRAAGQAGASASDLRPRLQAVRRVIEDTDAAHARVIRALATTWDEQLEAGAPAEERHRTLEALRDRILEQSYIDNLLATVKREMGE
jgi:molecular chaperone HscB